MEIRQIEAFVAVAETGSFTAAGERVNLTQSTISQQIKALEEELGEALFLRGKRQAQLTEAGERLLPHARLMLGALDDIASSFRARRSRPSRASAATRTRSTPRACARTTASARRRRS